MKVGGQHTLVFFLLTVFTLQVELGKIDNPFFLVHRTPFRNLAFLYNISVLRSIVCYNTITAAFYCVGCVLLFGFNKLAYNSLKRQIFWAHIGCTRSFSSIDVDRSWQCEPAGKSWNILKTANDLKIMLTPNGQVMFKDNKYIFK